jgi:hypothetical protein
LPNNFVDAEAIADAVECNNMRSVPTKTHDQLELQAIHRVRDRLIHFKDQREKKGDGLLGFLKTNARTLMSWSSFSLISKGVDVLLFWATPLRTELT